MPYPMAAISVSIKANNANTVYVPDYSDCIMLKTESVSESWPPASFLHSTMSETMWWILLDSSDNIIERKLAYNPEFDLSSLSGEKTIYMEYASDWAELTDLDCGTCELTGLDISPLTGILNLHCNNNALSTLDVTGNTLLVTLYCQDNTIAALDITNNTALTALYCNNNLLTELDMSENINVGSIDCSDNLIADTSMDSLIADLAAHESSNGLLVYGQAISPSRTSASDTDVEFLSGREWVVIEEQLFSE